MSEQPGSSVLIREIRNESVLVLTLNDPSRRNPLSAPIKEALLGALADAQQDPGIRAIVITGAGGHFSSGGDLAGMDMDGLAAGRSRMGRNKDLVRALTQSTKPLIAAIEGWCAGGSIGIALCCDTLVAGTGARFVASFPRVGLVPDLGLLHTLRRRVGDGPARQMLLYAEPIDAARAADIGLIDHVVPDGHALETAVERACALAKLAPMTIALTRQYLFTGIEAALDWEQNMQAALFLSADHEEGKAAFFGKREPDFKGK